MFTEHHIETDGVRIRYMEAGQGAPLVYLHAAGELHLTPAHDLLCRRFRVLALELPATETSGGRSMPELASTMARAIQSVGLEAFNLLGSSVAGTTALWMALAAPGQILALVLEAPAAIRPGGSEPSPGSPDVMAPGLRDLDGDTELETRLPAIVTPTLVLLGTRDATTAQRLGRACKDRIPNCHLVFVYDAGLAIGRDRPEAFAEVVTDFLERHEAFVISRTETMIHP